MKAKWDKEKEELSRQLEKDKLRDENGKLIVESNEHLGTRSYDFCWLPSLFGLFGLLLPKTCNYQFYYFISCFLSCMCIKTYFDSFFAENQIQEFKYSETDLE